MRVELGGGTNPRGDGFVNVDIMQVDTVDVYLDLETVNRGGAKLPFPDASVDALYSAHCWEHLDGHAGVLREVARVCRVGATVELRFPHWLHPMALCMSHKHVISDHQVKIWDSHPHLFFGGLPRRLKLVSVEYTPEVYLAEARALFPNMSDEQRMRFIPGCAHEVRYRLEVVPYA